VGVRAGWGVVGCEVSVMGMFAFFGGWSLGFIAGWGIRTIYPARTKSVGPPRARPKPRPRPIAGTSPPEPKDLRPEPTSPPPK
jgi:hypothetical protein